MFEHEELTKQQFKLLKMEIEMKKSKLLNASTNTAETNNWKHLKANKFKRKYFRWFSNFFTQITQPEI